PTLASTHQPQLEPQNVPPILKLHQSQRIPMPTARADPDNAPPSQTQKAVLESIAAGERLHAQCEVTRAGNQQSEAADQGTMDLVLNQDQDVPNLANVTSLQDIEHLSTATYELKDYPSAPDISNKPHTWAKAKQSSDTSHWEAAYQDELCSLLSQLATNLQHLALAPELQPPQTGLLNHLRPRPLPDQPPQQPPAIIAYHCHQPPPPQHSSAITTHDYHISLSPSYPRCFFQPQLPHKHQHWQPLVPLLAHNKASLATTKMPIMHHNHALLPVGLGHNTLHSCSPSCIPIIPCLHTPKARPSFEELPLHHMTCIDHRCHLAQSSGSILSPSTMTHHWSPDLSPGAYVPYSI
ncbi:hypothetical protein C0993_009406, partial [Termitomyces sp. T159_Od127]